MTTPAAITALISDADSRRKSATAALNQESRSDLGQFLTPAPVAKQRRVRHLFAAIKSRLERTGSN